MIGSYNKVVIFNTECPVIEHRKKAMKLKQNTNGGNVA